MRQAVNMFGALSLGVPRTFLYNSMFVLMYSASCEQHWDAAVIGGDGLAVCQRICVALTFSHLRKFRINFEAPLGYSAWVELV